MGMGTCLASEYLRFDSAHLHQNQLTIIQYPEIVETAALKLEPHRLTSYLQELAGLFHTYYGSVTFITDDAKLTAARAILLTATKQVLKNGLTLLRMTAPEVMLSKKLDNQNT
jgi:arginyl-tRNA synthetase